MFRGPLDIPLDSTGVRQAHTLAYYFEPIEISRIVYSPRKRSTLTAQIIAKDKDVDIIPNDGLYAWDVGDLAGKEKTPETNAIIQHHLKFPNIAMPGGESMNDFRHRIRPLLWDAVEMGDREGIPTLIVAHSSVVHEAGAMFNQSHTSTLVKPGGVAGIFIENGHLKAEPIFRPDVEGMQKGRAESMS